ncbi:hypothetical protein MMC11_007782 [Xylographa trunciseda]|nr:hypothetical protein [Xylographa trunciseda]
MTHLVSAEPESWNIKEYDTGGIRGRKGFSPSRTAVPKPVRQEQHITSTLVDKQATDMFVPNITLPRSPSCSPDSSLVASVLPTSETMRDEKSSSIIPAVHKMKPAAWNDLLGSHRYSRSAVVASSYNCSTGNLAEYDGVADRAPSIIDGQRTSSPRSDKSAPPRENLGGMPASPQRGISQSTIVSPSVVEVAVNGGHPHSPSIIIAPATEPGPGTVGANSDLKTKRKFSLGGTDEATSKKFRGATESSMISDRDPSVAGQDSIQSQPAVPRSASTANLDLRPGKRLIHKKAKVKIYMYFRNKEGTFVLWPFGKLHDNPFEDVCAKIAVEYERPTGSIVFEFIAGDTVTSVEIGRSSDEGYQRLDQKLKEVVRTCKHGGTIRINADPQTPEDTDPSWEYDPL